MEETRADRVKRVMAEARANNAMIDEIRARRESAQNDFTKVETPLPPPPPEPDLTTNIVRLAPKPEPEPKPVRKLSAMTDMVITNMIEAAKSEMISQLAEYRQFVHGLLIELVAEINQKQSDEIAALEQELSEARSQLDELASKLDQLESKLDELASGEGERSAKVTRLKA